MSVERMSRHLVEHEAVFGYGGDEIHECASLMILGGLHDGRYLMQPIRAAGSDGADGGALLAVPEE